ncbi:hypothetical protein AJ80_02321 [Polytolypa hystricis UAMH7299]|uniref:Uncharacterized protein n=1 Tax=Polytolypa hystricis (strain UAMH7299) TaxID=1447883 RepID=A0A2B7YR55_POLH7|nr:hypothetical protein AJ80_02321 [Polytolypa hystricis UAMH7299]
MALVLANSSPAIHECQFSGEACSTESTHYRKVISHIFGRNKRCTVSIPDYVWIYYCRKHYQRARYRTGEWPFRQCDLAADTIRNMRAWGGVEDFKLQLRRRETKRASVEPEQAAPLAITAPRIYSAIMPPLEDDRPIHNAPAHKPGSPTAINEAEHSMPVVKLEGRDSGYESIEETEHPVAPDAHTDTPNELTPVDGADHDMAFVKEETPDSDAATLVEAEHSASAFTPINGTGHSMTLPNPEETDSGDETIDEAERTPAPSTRKPAELLKKRSPTIKARPVPEWLHEHLGNKKSFNEILSLLQDLKAYLQIVSDRGEHPHFPDIEILPNLRRTGRPGRVSKVTARGAIAKVEHKKKKKSRRCCL